jgi:hypothetical protein
MFFERTPGSKTHPGLIAGHPHSRIGWLVHSTGRMNERVCGLMDGRVSGKTRRERLDPAAIATGTDFMVTTPLTL